MPLLRAAAKLFQLQGYSASGVNEIIRESSSPRGSFYYYFPDGKEQLAEETVRLTGGEIKELLAASFANASSFADGVDGICAGIAQWFAASAYTKGCPITSVHLEQSPQNPRLTAVCSEVFANWVGVVEKHAHQQIPDIDAARANELAQALILSLEGAWILSRASQSKQPFFIAAKMVKGLL
jgi:TetR/AcrR family transcriptional repressor of lmrAB and yxaGH operons